MTISRPFKDFLIQKAPKNTQDKEAFFFQVNSLSNRA